MYLRELGQKLDVLNLDIGDENLYESFVN